MKENKRESHGTGKKTNGKRASERSARNMKENKRESPAKGKKTNAKAPQHEENKARSKPRSIKETKRESQLERERKREYTAQDAMSVVDRSLEEELTKMDPATLQYLEQLLAENAPAARKAVQNVLDEPISQETQKRVEMAVARLDQEYLKYQRDKAAKKLRKEVIMEIRTKVQNEVKNYIQEILDENFNKMEIIEKHYPNIVVKKLWAFGWADAHKELAEAPYCEKQGQITKVFRCPKCNTCKLTGLCVACYKHEKKYHTLVGREEVDELDEKKCVKTWGETKLLSEINEQFKEGCKYDKEREKDVIRMVELIRMTGLKQSLEQRAAKKKLRESAEN